MMERNEKLRRREELLTSQFHDKWVEKKVKEIKEHLKNSGAKFYMGV